MSEKPEEHPAKPDDPPKPDGDEDDEGNDLDKNKIKKMIEQGLSVRHIFAIIKSAEPEAQRTLRHIYYLQYGTKIVESIVSKVASTWKISILFTFLTIAVQRLTDNQIVSVILSLFGLKELFG